MALAQWWLQEDYWDLKKVCQVLEAEKERYLAAGDDPYDFFSGERWYDICNPPEDAPSDY